MNIMYIQSNMIYYIYIYMYTSHVFMSTWHVFMPPSCHCRRTLLRGPHRCSELQRWRREGSVPRTVDTMDGFGWMFWDLFLNVMCSLSSVVSDGCFAVLLILFIERCQKEIYHPLGRATNRRTWKNWPFGGFWWILGHCCSMPLAGGCRDSITAVTWESCNPFLGLPSEWTTL